MWNETMERSFRPGFSARHSPRPRIEILWASSIGWAQAGQGGPPGGAPPDRRAPATEAFRQDRVARVLRPTLRDAALQDRAGRDDGVEPVLREVPGHRVDRRFHDQDGAGVVRGV